MTMRLIYLGALPPSPRDLSRSRQNDRRRRPQPPPAIPAAESALGLRPRRALSSAQVLPEWKTSTSPCNTFPSNGDNPLNFVSHSRGSVHPPVVSPPFLPLAKGKRKYGDVVLVPGGDTCRIPLTRR